MVQDRARVVIVGGGIAGASIAYHLAQLGWRDVAVLEQGELVSGTTSHAPGLVGQLRSTVGLTKMLMYSVSLYRLLRVDGLPGFFEVGSLRVASSSGRLDEIKRQSAFATSVGLDAHLLTPRETADLFPLMSLDGVEGALYLPSDGSATAPILAQAMLDAARAGGVAVYPHTPVQAIEKGDRGRVQAVITANGRIKTETLVVACGIWSPVVARMAGIALPLVPMQHQYAATAALPELVGRTVPNLRDPDKLVYLRQHDAGLVIGGYERDPRPFTAAIPDRPDPTVQQFDAAHFEALRTAAAERVPCIRDVELVRQVNGLESFTPDGEFLLGPSTQVPGLWFACGFCAHGVSGAGGVGKVLAEWIIAGQPCIDLTHLSPDRFGPQAADSGYVEQAARRVYGTYYDLRASSGQ